jgi:hypothetical protein
MKHAKRSQTISPRARCVCLALSLCLGLASPAFAEAPMNTDDAGTLDQGGMKLEATWSRDDGQRGGELLFGFGPLKNLEMEVSAAAAEDTTDGADSRLRVTGFGAKWVPYQNDTGWSLGARLDAGRTRTKDKIADQRTHDNEYALTALATYRLTNGQILHLNAGGKKTDGDAGNDSVGTWSIGYEIPLFNQVQLTLETYGEEHSQPTRSIGLRYTIMEGLKVSGAIGDGNNDKHLAQVGIAWEF